MKQLILASTIVLITCTMQSQLNLCLKGGFNYSQLNSDPDSLNSEGRIGYHFGADFRMGEKSMFMPGVHFYRIRTNLQTKEEIAGDDSFADDVLYNTFRIPINLGFYFVNNEDFKFGLTGGPSIWIPVTLIDENELAVAELMPFFLTANGTLSFQFWKISLDFIYTYGITEVHSQIPKSKLQCGSISLGFVI